MKGSLNSQEVYSREIFRRLTCGEKTVIFLVLKHQIKDKDDIVNVADLWYLIMQGRPYQRDRQPQKQIRSGFRNSKTV